MRSVYKSLQTYLGVPEDRRSDSEPKGIGVILDSSAGMQVESSKEEKQRRSAAQSLRRTLSADMSSKGWEARRNLMRKTYSSYELLCDPDEFSDSDTEDCHAKVDVDEDQEESPDSENASCESGEEQDFWSLIRPRTEQHSDAFPSLIAFNGAAKKDSSICGSQWEPSKPYVPPNAKKRSKLSERSLQLCTEGLGSESGSDCSYNWFTDSHSSESESDDDNISLLQEKEQNGEEMDNLKFSDSVCRSEICESEVIYGAKNIRKPRSFPPPLPSLSSCSGPCVSMKSCRQDGRFMLKAVEVASHKYLQANRQGGRLQLHFILHESSKPASQQHDADSPPENCKGTAASPKEPKAITVSNLSSLRQHILKSSCKNPSKKQAVPVNLKPGRPIKDDDLSLFKRLRQPPEISCSNCAEEAGDRGYEFQLHRKLCREIELMKSRDDDNNTNHGVDRKDQNYVGLSKSNEFSGAPASMVANFYTGWRDPSSQNKNTKWITSQSLVTSPSLLNYPLNRIRYADSVNESGHSLPKFPLEEGFGRCKERKWQSNYETYCLAIS